MRFLIVDESAAFRRTLSDMLRARWPEARVEEWDPRAQGKPSAVLEREKWSAVFLDSQPAGEDGMAWLRHFPPEVRPADGRQTEH